MPANSNPALSGDSAVSRLHAVIKQGPRGELTVADRGSTNGVVVNGARIEADTAIHNGDKIQVGQFELTLESSEDDNLVIQAANDHGGRDNISAMLIRVAEPYGVPRGWLARLKALFA